MTMGKLTTIIGDVTDPQFTAQDEIAVIPHCCNNKNIWGGGFVIALSKKWKQPEQKYRDFCESNISLPILGKTCFSKVNNHIAVANMIAQNGIISKDNLIPIKYQALVNCMADVGEYVQMIRVKTKKPVVIHAPKFGSLRAGGCFDFILELIREIWLENGIDLVIYEFTE